MLRAGLDRHTMVKEVSRVMGCYSTSTSTGTGLPCGVVICCAEFSSWAAPTAQKDAKSCIQPPAASRTCLCAWVARPTARRSNEDACKHNRSRQKCRCSRCHAPCMHRFRSRHFRIRIMTSCKAISPTTLILEVAHSENIVKKEFGNINVGVRLNST